jgi:hypothetical protein
VIELGEKIPRETREEVGEFLVEQILSKVASRKSPVTGDSFDKLSDDYKKKKQAEGLSGVPNLESSGDMLDALDYRVTSRGIEIGVFGDDAPKADGHNNLSGNSQLPERRFIPAVGEGFMPSIEREVERIIADAVAESAEPDVRALGSIESKTELYDYLMPIFGLTTRTETRLAVLRSDRWIAALSRLGLLSKL